MLSGCATAGLAIVVWGTGGVKLLNRRVTELEDDVALNQKRLEREVKQRAALSSKPTPHDHMAEAMAIVKQTGKTDAQLAPGGRFMG